VSHYKKYGTWLCYNIIILTNFLLGMSKSLGLMILLARLKFCWRILNFAGAVFEAKVAPTKDSRQQNSAGAHQKIPSLLNRIIENYHN
jgi:hypothetical protein